MPAGWPHASHPNKGSARNSSRSNRSHRGIHRIWQEASCAHASIPPLPWLDSARIKGKSKKLLPGGIPNHCFPLSANPSVSAVFLTVVPAIPQSRTMALPGAGRLPASDAFSSRNHSRSDFFSLNVRLTPRAAILLSSRRGCGVAGLGGRPFWLICQTRGGCWRSRGIATQNGC
jgi:hypothetical protein